MRSLTIPSPIRKSPPAAAALLALTLVSIGSAQADEAKGPWERVSNGEGILVDRRTVAGSPLKEFRGRATVDAPLGRVLAVIRDTRRAKEWMGECSQSDVIEEDMAARVQIAYHRTRAPWPVADRDSVNRAELRVEPQNRRVYIPFTAIDYPKVPPVKGVVRMPFVRGHWILWPNSDGKTTQVEYQVHANPGGSLPDWLSNLASKKLPLITIQGLRKQVQRTSYPAFEAEVASSKEMAEMREALSGKPPAAAPEGARQGD